MKDDLISREALRKAFHYRIKFFNKSDWDKAMLIIDTIPAAEERPQGKWIFEEHGYLICSNCGYDCSHDEEGSYIRGSYCYNCGADMREADNGTL